MTARRSATPRTPGGGRTSSAAVDLAGQLVVGRGEALVDRLQRRGDGVERVGHLAATLVPLAHEVVELVGHLVVAVDRVGDVADVAAQPARRVVDLTFERADVRQVDVDLLGHQPIASSAAVGSSVGSSGRKNVIVSASRMNRSLNSGARSTFVVVNCNIPAYSPVVPMGTRYVSPNHRCTGVRACSAWYSRRRRTARPARSVHTSTGRTSVIRASSL